jgi:phage tail sheath protein FI
MPFQLSPGVAVVEKDFSAIVPAVSSSIGAYAGTFAWGPVLDPVTIDSENTLVQRFGKPDAVDGNQFKSFFTAANFLAYTNNLLTVRVDATNARNSVASPKFGLKLIPVTGGGTGYDANNPPAVTIPAPTTGGVQATATAVISSGNVTSILITNPGLGYATAPTVTIAAPTSGTQATIGTVILTDAAVGLKINNFTDYTNYWANGAGIVGEWAGKYPGALGNSLSVSMVDSAQYSAWAYKAEFSGAPGTSAYVTKANTVSGGALDELHIVVIDKLGLWTGTVGAVLEKFAFVSKASDATKSDGTNNYYVNVVNNQSKYIWWMDHTTWVAGTGKDWGTTASGSTAYAAMNDPTKVTVLLIGGADDFSPLDGRIQDGYALFANAEQYDISLIPCGPVNGSTAKWIHDNVVLKRLDCVSFVSPLNISDNSIIQGSTSTQATQIVAFRNDASFNVDSSYAVLDSGYKYQYDRYNDKYRWVPLNGDVAGLCARTDYTNDPWWSPGGLNRGQIKNVVKLAFNPSKTDRDTLYKAGVNPVVSFPGQGTVLFGDKTLQSKPSAFDRINVRRLFIVLEKAIATASKYQLFEFNDSFTRAQFTNMVTPFLRDVQGRRGIIDFRVVCNDTNNTGEVIDRNEFVADIYIKPARSINFITLNFIAARTSINFEEIGA